MYGFVKKQLLFIISIAIIAITAFSLFAQDKNVNKNKAVKMKEVKIITFTDIQGNAIWARVITENREYVIISYPLDGAIHTETLQRSSLMPDSVIQQNISEYDYWNKMGEYFSSNTWDFKNDGEDFIQAQRCYEKALEIVSKFRGPDHPLTAQINKKIEDLNLDSKKWKETAEKRSEFKKLEFEAELTKRLEIIESSINDNAEAIAELERSLEDYEDMDEKIITLKQEVVSNFKITKENIEDINKDVESNTIQIDRLWRRYDDSQYKIRSTKKQQDL